MSERGGESKNIVDNANFSLALLQLTVHGRRGNRSSEIQQRKAHDYADITESKPSVRIIDW